MEQRCVIVEDVPILHESRGSAPRHVQVLRFIGVESVVKVRDRPQHEREHGKHNQDQPLAAYRSSHLNEDGAP